MLYVTESQLPAGRIPVLHIPRDVDSLVRYSKSLCGIRKRTPWKVVQKEQPSEDNQVEGAILCTNCISSAKMRLKTRHFETIWKNQCMARGSMKSGASDV